VGKNKNRLFTVDSSGLDFFYFIKKWMINFPILLRKQIVIQFDDIRDGIFIM